MERLEFITVVFLLVIGGPQLASANPHPTSASPKLLKFVHDLLRDGHPGPYLNCSWSVERSYGVRKFSNGPRQVPVLRVSMHSELYGLGGEMDISVGFSTYSEVEQAEYDDPNFGRVERITLLGSEPQHHYMVVEHDGRGTISKIEMGSIYRQVMCYGP